MLPEKHLKVLKRIYPKLKANDVRWVVTGSVSFCLQGVPVSPNDIDIQTDKPSAYKIESIFRDKVVKKVEFSATDRIKSHFGALRIDGVLVEIMGAVQKFYDGSWEDPIDIDKYKRKVSLEDMEIPVLNLGYEAEAYRRFGRLKMAKKLKNYADIDDRTDGSRGTTG